MIGRKGFALASACVITAVVVTGSAEGASTVAWSSCTDTDLAGLDCARVGVPMDYQQPDGPQVDIAISRLRATDPGRRRGVLFTNPGGPGGAGLSMPADYREQPITAVYDIIGLDPRGVGRSTQLTCQANEGGPDLTSRPTEAELPRFTEVARRDEAACLATGGQLRRQVTTMNTARDMDRVRAALGESKINYLGMSYGTFLGAVYGQLFPNHLDRSVLDSAMDPNEPVRQQLADALGVIKTNFDAWAAWTADRNGTFHLGTTPRAVRASIEKIAAATAVKPAAGFDNQTDFDTAVGTSTRYRPLWAAFATNMYKALTELKVAAKDSALAADNKRAVAAMKQLSAPVNGVYNAVTCETPWPTDMDTYYRAMRTARDSMPYGNAVSYVAPNNCAFSKVGFEAPTPIGTARYPRGLVLQATGDVNTPYINGVHMAATLGSVLITVPDEGFHGEYNASGDASMPAKPNKCVDDKVNAYLVDGVLPTGRVDCASVNPPEAAAPDNKPAGPVVLLSSLGALAEKLLTAVLHR